MTSAVTDVSTFWSLAVSTNTRRTGTRIRTIRSGCGKSTSSSSACVANRRLSSTCAEISRGQVICHWDGRWGWIEPVAKEPRKPWRFVAIDDRQDWSQFYHGEGVGDVNGDGRLDLIINDGWYEQPANDRLRWLFHQGKFSTERGGAQMFAYDVDGDGDP